MGFHCFYIKKKTDLTWNGKCRISSLCCHKLLFCFAFLSVALTLIVKPEKGSLEERSLEKGSLEESSLEKGSLEQSSLEFWGSCVSFLFVSLRMASKNIVRASR